jgi:hypothetical protein
VEIAANMRFLCKLKLQNLVPCLLKSLQSRVNKIQSCHLQPTHRILQQTQASSLLNSILDFPTAYTSDVSDSERKTIF